MFLYLIYHEIALKFILDIILCKDSSFVQNFVTFLVIQKQNNYENEDKVKGKIYKE